MSTRDLSRSIESGMPGYPGDPPVTIDPHAGMAADGYRVSALRLGSHAGTHVDAPAHTEPDGATIDELPVDRFEWSARVVDLRTKGPREPIDPGDLPEADADLLVVDTGWAARWGTPAMREHPFLAESAAAWCADRGYDVATDALSVDPTPGADADATEQGGVPAHHALLGEGRVIVENLRSLRGLPDRFVLRAYPIDVAAGDAAPARAVAVPELE